MVPDGGAEQILQEALQAGCGQDCCAEALTRLHGALVAHYDGKGADGAKAAFEERKQLLLQMSSLEEQLAAARTELSRAADGAQPRVDPTQVARYQERTARAEAEAERLQLDVDRQAATIAELRKQLSESDLEHVAGLHSVSSHVSLGERGVLTERNAGLGTEGSGYLSKADVGPMEHLRTVVRMLKSQLDRSQQEARDATDRAGALEQELAILKARDGLKQAEAQVLESERKEALKSVSELEVALRRLAEVEERNRYLLKAMDDLHNEKLALRGELDEALVRGHTMEMEAEVLKIKAMDANGRYEDRQSLVNDLSTQLAERRAAEAALEQKVQDRDSDIVMLEMKIRSVCDELVERQAELHLAEARIDQTASLSNARAAEADVRAEMYRSALVRVERTMLRLHCVDSELSAHYHGEEGAWETHLPSGLGGAGHGSIGVPTSPATTTDHELAVVRGRVVRVSGTVSDIRPGSPGRTPGNDSVCEEGPDQVPAAGSDSALTTAQLGLVDEEHMLQLALRAEDVIALWTARIERLPVAAWFWWWRTVAYGHVVRRQLRRVHAGATKRERCRGALRAAVELWKGSVDLGRVRRGHLRRAMRRTFWYWLGLAFDKWAAAGRARRDVRRRIAGRIRCFQMWRPWARWTEMAAERKKNIRRAYAVFKRMLMCEVARPFQTWKAVIASRTRRRGEVRARMRLCARRMVYSAEGRSFNTWRGRVEDLARNRARLGQMLYRLCNLRVARAVNRWASAVRDKVVLMARMRLAIRRLKMYASLRALNRWTDCVRNRALYRRSTLRMAATRMAHHREAAALRKWQAVTLRAAHIRRVARAVIARSAKMNLAVGVRHWRRNSSIVQQRNRTKSQVVVRMINRRTSVAFDSWRAAKDRASEKKMKIRRVLLRTSGNLVARALNTWSANASAIRDSRRRLVMAISRMVNRSLYTSLNSWVAFTKRRARSRSLLRQMGARWRSQGLARGWNTWRSSMASLMSRKGRMRRTIMHMRRQSLSAALATWNERKVTRRRRRRQSVRHLARMTNFAVLKMWTSWVGWLACRQEKRRMMTRARQKVASRRLVLAFVRWAGIHRARRVHRRRATTVFTRQRNLSVAKSLSVWMEAVARGHTCRRASVRAEEASRTRRASQAMTAWRDASRAAAQRYQMHKVLRRMKYLRMARALGQWVSVVVSGAAQPQGRRDSIVAWRRAGSHSSRQDFKRRLTGAFAVATDRHRTHIQLVMGFIGWRAAAGRRRRRGAFSRGAAIHRVWAALTLAQVNQSLRDALDEEGRKSADLEERLGILKTSFEELLDELHCCSSAAPPPLPPPSEDSFPDLGTEGSLRGSALF